MAALAGMRRISARFTGGFVYNGGIFVCMSVGQLRNSFFRYKAADGTGEFHYAVSRFRCFLRDFAFAIGMQFGIQPDIASLAAGRPVFVLIVLKLA